MQWIHFKQLSTILNETNIIEIKEVAFLTYIKKHKDDLIFSEAIDLFMKQIEPTKEFIESNKELCSLIADIITKVDKQKLDIGLRSRIRLRIFEDCMIDIL